MIAILKTEDDTFVASANRDAFIDLSLSDLLLDENLGVWKLKGHKGWFVAVRKPMTSSDLLRYEDELFADEISLISLSRHTLPMMRKIFAERGILNDGTWFNNLYVFNSQVAYCVDSYFNVYEVDFIETAGKDAIVLRGSLEFTNGSKLTPLERLNEAYHGLELNRQHQLYPVVALQASTGKKQIWHSYEDAKAKISR